MSEVEWWEARLSPALKFRGAHPATPIALLADVGRSHCDSSDALVEFLALFIRKAFAARMPEPAPNDRAPVLRSVQPLQGWLVDRWRHDDSPRAATAPFADYRGERAEALWCFDEETARATEIYYARTRGKKTQQVDFLQGGGFAPISSSHAGVELKFLPLDDGITFSVDAGFIAPLPPKPPLATKDKAPPPTVVISTAAAPGTHAVGAVRVTRIAGAVAQVADTTWRIALNRIASTTDRRGADLWLLAEHSGDATYKSAVQQALLRVPVNASGAGQRLTFPEIPDQAAGAKTLKLAATSDAGARVSYYVREGPAEIEGDTMRFTTIPPRAKFPLKVTVVAWQFGRGIEPKLKAAAPVERSFSLLR